MQWVPVPIVAPLLAAALLSGLSNWLPRRIIDLTACLTAGGVLAVCGFLAWFSLHHGPMVYWFGGWNPSKSFPLGICFVVDPLGAGMAALVSLLMLSAFLFACAYFDSVKSLFHAVMLIFLAAMCGLCITGDLFNLFVWFELMSAAGVMLCGYKSEEVGPLQGAINFAVINTLGAYLTLIGIGILYAQTSALNMAQVGEALASGGVSTNSVVIGFIFFAAGFLVKAAAFPFHFWLADAHAVAPTPVCILFSGVMVELGLFAVARVYWTVFSIPLESHADAVRHLFLIVGILTALVGGIEAFNQRHLKRLLAFSTISHMGIMVIGFALLDQVSLSGMALYVLGHGLVKSVLFICAGILLNRFQSVDEFELQGAGKRMRWTGLIMFIGAVGLSGVPPFANYFGEAQMDMSLEDHHLHGFSYAILIGSALTSAAVLRLACRVFLGWGERDEDTRTIADKIPMDRESHGHSASTPATMFVPAAVLLALALIIGTASTCRSLTANAAAAFEDAPANHALVLHATAWRQPKPANPQASWGDSRNQFAALVLAALLALWGLYPGASGSVSRRVSDLAGHAQRPLRAIHSGRIGDYVAWFVLGIAAYGGFLVVSVR